MLSVTYSQWIEGFDDSCDFLPNLAVQNGSYSYISAKLGPSQP